MKIECGMIVKSVAGRDKDRYYLVMKMEKKRVFIADGKVRKLNSLKQKNPLHLKGTRNIVDILKYTTDKKIRQLLHRFNYE